jgi:hypothetical protein
LLFPLAPVQTSSPSPVFRVWFTMTDPKAAKGHGSPSARLACLIQYDLVVDGIIPYSSPAVVAGASMCVCFSVDRNPQYLKQPAEERKAKTAHSDAAAGSVLQMNGPSCTRILEIEGLGYYTGELHSLKMIVWAVERRSCNDVAEQKQVLF